MSMQGGLTLSRIDEIPARESLRQLTVFTAQRCGIDLEAAAGAVEMASPINGEPASAVAWASADDVAAVVDRAQSAFGAWRSRPAPERGALVKRFAQLLSEHKDDL